ncbi:hypothetical protein NUW54_g11804 [Trametes sanguinea]|uniref:Uncharacterized protein n=1 Tax=Trametes sanguinea TaxID=158606 RepID=A0ACC1N6R4_9APHY|nr:hypothetical protein NUW54_g11804 [Trametes sanguinea]
MSWISTAWSKIDHAKAAILKTTRLSFQREPLSLLDPMSEFDSTDINTYNFCKLEALLVETEADLERMQHIGHTDADHRHDALLRRTRTILRSLDDHKNREWDRVKIESVLRQTQEHLANNGPLMLSALSKARGEKARGLQPFVLAAFIMVTVLHSIAATARLKSQYILATIEAVLYGAFVFSNVAASSGPTLNLLQANVLRNFPQDARTAMAALGVEPDGVTHFACCSKCGDTYSPNRRRPDDAYPHFCSNRETDKPICGNPLVYQQTHVPTTKNGPSRTTWEPFQIFPYRTCSSWIADLFQRPGLDLLARAAWEPVLRPLKTRWHDIWDAPVLRDFLGPDKKTLFARQPDGAVHLIFSMFVDWFNPHGNKKAGKSHSIGVIYLACHNLPPHLRYLPENIYLAGVIPGPKEPELHQLNHFLRPLIDELVILWERGLYLPQTASRSAGLPVLARVLAPGSRVMI